MTKGTYILAPHVALRSWERIPHAYVVRGQARPRLLSSEEFGVAVLCDGKTPLDSSAALSSLLQRRLVAPCKAGEGVLSPWQRHRSYRNRVMPWLGLEITARCNYNCIHCFNAVDNGRLHDEMTLGHAERVLDEARAIGVQAVLLTGGEPLLHPQFMEIVQAVYARDMFVFEINTNGRFLDATLLDKIAAFGIKPEMKISFDGLGFHDWMRGCKGAEADALRAIELCISKEFPVRVQMNINRRNRESVLPSLELLDSMGVGRARVIPTTPSVRWEMNAQGQSMGWPEYLETALGISKSYAAVEHAMELNFWRVLTLRPLARAFSLDVIRYSESSFKLSRPCCRQINGMVSVAANGELYPCLQCSGWFSAHGVSFGNAFETRLISVLNAGSYCDTVHATVLDKLTYQRGRFAGVGCRSCADCSWLAWCAGGCPALAALAHDGDMLMLDPCACEFFSGGWGQRFVSALASWRCASELPLNFSDDSISDFEGSLSGSSSS